MTDEQQVAMRLIHLVVDSALLLEPNLRHAHIRRQAIALARKTLGPGDLDRVALISSCLAEAAIAMLNAIELGGGEMGHAYIRH